MASHNQANEVQKPSRVLNLVTIFSAAGSHALFGQRDLDRGVPADALGAFLLKVSLIMTGKGAGGLQQRLVLYTTALLQEGHEVQVFVYRKSPLVPNLLDLGLKPEFVNFHCWSRWRKLSVPSIWWKLRRFSPDIVVGFAQKGLKVARAAVGRKYPLITHIGSLDPALLKTLTIADGYFATSEQMIELLIQVGIDRSRIRLLPNFLTFTSLPAKMVAFTNPIRIVTLGRFVERKGFSTLLRAVRELRDRGHDIKVVIAGDGPEKSKLQEECRSIAIEGAVEFPGWLDDKSKFQLLSSADIFVCPSLHEPFGLVLIEAAQAGLPIVTTATNGAKHIFRDGVDALFTPVGNAIAMADRIESVVRDTTLAQSLADQASLMFHDKFHISKAAPKFVALLSEMAQLGSSMNR